MGKEENKAADSAPQAFEASADAAKILTLDT